MARQWLLYGNWLTSNPQRLRLVLFGLMLVLTLVALLMPTGVVWAQPDAGSGG